MINIPKLQILFDFHLVIDLGKWGQAGCKGWHNVGSWIQLGRENGLLVFEGWMHCFDCWFILILFTVFITLLYVN